MTAIECLKVLRKGFILLLIWNLLITGTLLIQFSSQKEDKLNQQICNLECIPDSDLEVE